jgi:TonB family protein
MNLKSERKAHIVSLLFLAVFCILAAGSMGTPAPTGTNASLANDYQQSSSPAFKGAESVIRISAENLLAEFQRSEADKEVRIKNESLSTYLNDNTETAEARDKGKRIELTGIVTGVFIPSLETSRRILESRGKGIFDEQGGAGSFITMGGPYPHSAEETLLLPGITAWSRTGDSLQPTFGQQDIESLSGRLVVGKQASLLCSFSSSSGSSPTTVSISLEDCILEPSSPLPPPTVPAPGPVQSIKTSTQNSEADVLFQQQRYSEALPLLDQGCTADDGEACKDLGMIYGNGLGFPQDIPHAVELFSKSCNQGNARGCFDLGISYKSGKGVTQDYAHAVALFSQSCDGGDTKGCEALGLMYNLGIGVARDALHAVTLYSKACNGGDADGCDHVKGNTNNLEADAHLDKATRTSIAMLKYRAHPADLDSSFTAPHIDTVDDNKVSDKTPLKGISGQVVLVCMIEPSGTCRHWEVLKSVNPDEDQAVIDGLSKAHFVPATEYGHPITYPFFQAVTLNFGPGK